MSLPRKTLLAAVALALAPLAPALAAIPYSPVPVFGPPVVGPGVMPPDFVYGKEYSHDLDFSTIGPALDTEQVIAWDGGGGTADAMDYTGTRSSWKVDQEVDALANSRDALFTELLFDEAHLTFSHDDMINAYGLGAGAGSTVIPIPSTGPIFLSNGNMIGGAGEVSIEHSGVFVPSFPATQELWASAPEVNGDPEPIDVDGTEYWGPEPGFSEEPDDPVFGDADKYSLDTDAPSGVSVWNASGTSYIDLPTIIGAVESLLGPVPGSAGTPLDEAQGHQAINLDALMVNDVVGSPDRFDLETVAALRTTDGEMLDQNAEPIMPFHPDGEMRGDTVIFSIRQMVDPMDPDGYYATGSELFVLDSSGKVDFLKHGGHAWDHAYTLSEMAIEGFGDEEFEGHAVIDINAIEAIGEDQSDRLPGDFNRDGVVDAADYTVWRDTAGASGSGLLADGNSDGIVNEDDYAVWRDNFGATLSGPSSLSAPASAVASPLAAASATAVPEPGTLGLLAAGVLGVAFRRRR